LKIQRPASRLNQWWAEQQTTWEIEMAARTSVKVAAVTGAAKDDMFASSATGLTEDSSSANLNVLINDPGASVLYSLAQNVPGTPAMATFPVMTTAFSASGATISINPDGTIAYDGSTIAGLQALHAGETWTDTFTYTIRMAEGALSTATATVTIAGANDPAVFSGDDSGSVFEDGLLVTGGTLVVTDVDHDESGFLAPGDLSGDHGTFTFAAATGLWNYTLDNLDAAVQALNTGDTLTETLTVMSIDGTSHDIVVTINGEDDVALPPTGGGDGEGEGDGGRHMINYGLVANDSVDEDGFYIITDFGAGDFLQYSQNLTHGAPVGYDSDDNGSLDSTSVTFFYSNPDPGQIQVILIGYTDVVAFAHEV
jgi:VCBS repeat-containing protein